MSKPITAEAPQLLYFQDDGEVPNSHLPVLFYRDVAVPGKDHAKALEELFKANFWVPKWRDGIFDYHHYHSNAHEVLGVVAGNAQVVLGGDGEYGREITLVPGDIIVLPAGVGHCAIEQTDDFMVVGAYPLGQENYDVQPADTSTHASSRKRVLRVPLPVADPLTGNDGALMKAWYGGA